MGPRRLGRQPPSGPASGLGAHKTARLGDQHALEAKDALYLIREEIAIMKKLNHPNLVQLIEVLDDPKEDSLYMVLEMCKKGVVMKVGLDDPADPYPPEKCRCWFRDLILGIEYCESYRCLAKTGSANLTPQYMPRESSIGTSSQTTCYLQKTTSSR